jgi:hypothetical protein
MCYKDRIRKSGDHVNRLLRKLSLYVAIPSLMVGALSGCGGGNTPSDDDPATTPPAQLLQSDLQSLPNISTVGPQQYDILTKGEFSGVFGGTSTADIVTYLNDRVHYYLTKDDDAGVYPAKFKIDGWEKDGSDTSDKHRIRSASLFEHSGNVVVGAINIGTQLWLDGLVNNVDVKLILGDQEIPVDSSRVGIVMLGEGYTDKIRDEEGHWMDQPAFIRQGILLHEARHSDCTGGVSDDDLEVARHATSAQEFAQETKMTTCGHLHSFCPKDMKPYGNLPACDNEAWGAYSVEATFLSAMSVGDLSEVDKNIALASAIDRASRVEVGMHGLIHLKSAGAPDMSTSGHRDSH